MKNSLLSDWPLDYIYSQSFYMLLSENERKNTPKNEDIKNKFTMIWHVKLLTCVPLFHSSFFIPPNRFDELNPCLSTIKCAQKSVIIITSQPFICKNMRSWEIHWTSCCPFCSILAHPKCPWPTSWLCLLFHSKNHASVHVAKVHSLLRHFDSACLPIHTISENGR